MRRRIIHMLFIVAMCITKVHGQDAPASAQPTPREKLEAYRVAYITRQLDLSPAEAEKFWPLYNQYAKEIMQVNQQRAATNAGKVQTATPAKSDLEYDQQILDIRKRYYEQFKKVLPPAKVEHLYKAEHDFKVHVVKQLAARKGGMNRQGMRQRPGLK